MISVKLFLDFSDENLEKHCDKVETIEKGFMFHDLYGNPMMINDFKVIKYTPKK
jgi:hypothetical protein